MLRALGEGIQGLKAMGPGEVGGSWRRSSAPGPLTEVGSAWGRGGSVKGEEWGEEGEVRRERRRGRTVESERWRGEPEVQLQKSAELARVNSAER